MFSGIFYIAYACMHLPAGLLIARYGLRKVLPFAIFISALGFLPIIYSDNWCILILGRFIMGAGSSFGIAAAFYMLSGASPKKFGNMIAITFSSGLSAAIIGGAPLAKCLDVFGFTATIQGLTLIGFFVAALACAIKPIRKNNKKITWQDVKSSIKNRHLLLISIAGGLVASAAVFSDTWGARFLGMKYGVDPVDAAQLTAYVFVGRVIGYPLCAYLLSLTHYMRLAFALSICMVCVFLFLLLGPILPYIVCSALFILMGIFYCCVLPTLYAASRQVTPKLAVLALSLSNLSTMAVIYCVDMIVGIAIDSFGGLGDIKAFQNSLLFIPALCILGILTFFYVNRSITKTS